MIEKRNKELIDVLDRVVYDVVTPGVVPILDVYKMIEDAFGLIKGYHFSGLVKIHCSNSPILFTSSLASNIVYTY